MPRTSIIVGKKHPTKEQPKGEWVLLQTPDEPLHEQNKFYRAFLGTKSHDELCYLQQQESDGHERHLFFMTPDKHKAHDALRAKEDADAKKAGEAEYVSREKRIRDSELERIEHHKSEVDAINKAAEGDRTRGPARKSAASGYDKPSDAPDEPPAGAPLDAAGLRLDGPTVEEWMAIGYSESAYPPKGYAKRQSYGTPEERGEGAVNAPLAPASAGKTAPGTAVPDKKIAPTPEGGAAK